ncbi:hypothetical protein M5K25_013473 [Dendrobium thyrsiflorum]|uniref:Uncharacterized protein n=1 Tax=Dendrobium thyrsiflorum TaxID=117978 RepID=A0ABD0UTV7_DENTH
MAICCLEVDVCVLSRLVDCISKSNQILDESPFLWCGQCQHIQGPIINKVVESKTEHTEDDISNEVKAGSLPFESNGSEPFTFPGLRNDLESIEREFIGGLSTLMEATEKMANEFFNSFGVPSIQSSWPPLDHRRLPEHWQHESRTSKEMKDHIADLDVEIREV